MVGQLIQGQITKGRQEVVVKVAQGFAQGRLFDCLFILDEPLISDLFKGRCFCGFTLSLPSEL